MSKFSTNVGLAAQIIQEGGIVAFPTETVYGLGANALDEDAVSKIFDIKKRPANNPLIVHISQESDLDKVTRSIPIKAKILINHFWPGPLTLILPKKNNVPSITSANLDTIAVRIPNHPIALKLINKSGVPIAAPSANSSGKPSPTTAEHVQNDLADKVDLILDGGECDVGLESTVLDLTVEPPVIWRPGAVTKEQIEKLIGNVEVKETIQNNIPKSPGLLHKHYSPNSPLFIFEPEEIITEAKKYLKENKKVAILTTKENIDIYPQNADILSLGHRSSLQEIAHNLYDALIETDNLKVDVILSESFPEKGIGMAIMDRLKRASENK